MDKILLKPRVFKRRGLKKKLGENEKPVIVVEQSRLGLNGESPDL